MSTHDEELKQGFLTRALSNPFISIPFAIASGVGAGLTPATARATSGVHTGLNIGLAAEADKFERQKQQRLSQVLSQTAQTSLIDPQERPKTFQDLDKELQAAGKAGGRVSDFVNPSPTVTTPRSAREQRLGSLIQRMAPVAPNKARDLLSEEVARIPKPPTPFGGAKAGFHVMEGGNARQVVAPVPGSTGQGRQAPSLDDNLINQALAEIKGELPFGPRVLEALGTDDREEGVKKIQFASQIRTEKKQKEQEDAAALVQARADARLDAEPMQGMTLDATTGEVVNITRGNYRDAPKKYLRLTPSQERMKGGLDTATTHIAVMSRFMGALPKGGVRLTNALGRKLDQFLNDAEAVVVFQQLDAMTSLAVGSALVSGGGGRPGVRLAEFMKPAGVTEGDTLAVAVNKMRVWMDIVKRNAREAGLPVVSYDRTIKELNDAVVKGLVEDAKGSVVDAQKEAATLGIILDWGGQKVGGATIGETETKEQVAARYGIQLEKK